MIAKFTTGNGFEGSLRYDVRAGKGRERNLAKVLDVCGVTFDYNRKGDLLINPKQVGFDFRQQTMGYTGKGTIRKPVYHWALSYSPKDNVSEAQMQKDATEFLKRIGFEDTQYVMTAHYDKEHMHLHIVTNVINNQGGRIPTMGLIDKAHAAAAAITRENGYTWGEKAKKDTIERAHQPHERARFMLRPIIEAAIANACSMDEFRNTLEKQGVSCIIKLAQDGKRGGISFGYELDVMLHTFTGSSIGRQLSFGYISKTIQKNVAKLKEAAPKPKIKFDFVAASRKVAQPQATRPMQSTNAPQLVNIYSVMMNAGTKQQFNTILLSQMVSVEPVFDRYGGVSDFKVTLAREGRVTNANGLFPSEQLRSMFDRWEGWTGQTPAYKLAIERERRKTLEDICLKLDLALPNNGPRTPRDITMSPDGQVQSVSYTNSKGKDITLKVNADNYIRWKDGSAIDIVSGRYYAPRPQQEETRSLGIKFRK